MATARSRRQRWLSLVLAILFIGAAVAAVVLITPIDTAHATVDASPTLTALPPTVTPPLSSTTTPRP